MFIFLLLVFISSPVLSFSFYLQTQSGANPVLFFQLLTSPPDYSLFIIHSLSCAPCPLSEALVYVLLVETSVSPSISWTVLACCLAALRADHTRLYTADLVQRRRSHSGWWTGGERWLWLFSLLIRVGRKLLKNPERKLKSQKHKTKKQKKGCNVSDKIYLPSDAPRLPGPGTHSQHPVHWGKMLVNKITKMFL